MNSQESAARHQGGPDRAALTDRLTEEPLTPQQAEFILRQLASAFVPGLTEPRPPAAAEERSPTEADHAARLRKAEARFHTLVERIPAVTFMAALDEGVNELYVSPQIETLLGFSQQEWLENPILWYTQLHPDDRVRWHEDFARTCALGVPFRSEYRFLTRDGRVVWVHGECQVVRDQNGRPLFLQGIAFDITNSKRAEEALRRMHAELADLVRERTAELAKTNEALHEEIRERRRLEEALRQRADQLAEEVRRKDQFLAILAHELRNPLAPLTNALQILRQPGAQASTVAWAQEVMDRQVRHLTRLIDDLLDVSRINQGKIELRKEVVDLATIVARAVETTRPFLAERRHELTVTLPPEALPLHADPLRLDQVLVNLLNNAGKYTEPGGHIWLSAAREGGEAVVRVRDTGIGIPPEMLERIFELFTQAHRSLATRFQWGLGIGLTLVRRLVELHGGSVRAYSAGPGQGSELVVRLPLLVGDVDGVPGGTGEPARSPAAGRGRTVLVVDDNNDMAESLAILLRGWGHVVRVAGDGPAALQAARAETPEVVLLDIGLPGMTGYEVARRLRELPGFTQTVLVALSGYGRDEDRCRSREVGFDIHLVKPVDPDELRELLRDPARLTRPVAAKDR